MLTEKQTRYIEYLEEAAQQIDWRECYGCCTAITTAVERLWRSGNPHFIEASELIAFLEDTFQDNSPAMYWWACDEEGLFQRVLALSFLIDMIETENLYAD